MFALETISLNKSYGHRRVIKDLNMHVPQGSIYGFVGKNGAGKSTVMKMVDHLVKPTSGTIEIFGDDGSKGGPRIQRIGSLIENPGVLPNLNAFDNLMAKALAIGLVDSKKSCNEMLKTVGLADAGSKRVKKFSLGMKQRLGIGLALLGQPDLLLLDEPFNGLDPEGTRELRNLIATLNRTRGITVIISSHVLDQLDRIATDYGVIADGQMVVELTTEQVAEECGDSLRIRTDKPELTLIKLQEMFPEYSCVMEPGNALRINGTIDGDTIARALADEGIVILELTVTRRDIEDFFVNLMEGGARDVQSA